VSTASALRSTVRALLLLAVGLRAARRDPPAPRRRATGRGELVLGGPVGAQRLVVCQPAAATGGRLVVMDARFPPGSRRPPDHRHPEQEEQLELLAGALRARMDGRERALAPGDVLVVPPGARHAVWNEAPIEARAVRQLHPALGTEALLTDLAAALERGGPTAAWRLLRVLRAHRRELRLDAADMLLAIITPPRSRP
jgi:quercetin dioxygenase-like cupin family protein